MTAHSCAILAAVLFLAKAPVRVASQPVEAELGASVPPARALGLALAALAAAGVLIAGQVLHQSKTYASSTISAGPVTNTLAPAIRQFQILDGQFQFNLAEVPLMGRPDAPHVMVSLFDYTCHHCRQMHTPLWQASQQFSNQLAIINVPMPLDGKCNPLITQVLKPHTNACALARVGLTVWRADRKAAPVFDEWVFTTTLPPLPEAAEAFARQLVGTEAFDRASTNAWVDQQIRQDCAIYAAVYKKFRKGAMPEVIIGTNLISGTFTSNQLAQLLADQFGLKGPSPAPAASQP